MFDELLETIDGIDVEYIWAMQDAIKELDKKVEGDIENKDDVVTFYYEGGGGYDCVGDSYWTYEIFKKSDLNDERVRIGKAFGIDLTEYYTLYELLMLMGEEKQKVIGELSKQLKGTK